MNRSFVLEGEGDPNEEETLESKPGYAPERKGFARALRASVVLFFFSIYTWQFQRLPSCRLDEP